MRVGAEDGGDLRVAHGTQDRLDMAFTIHVLGIADAEPAPRRARIDNGNFISRADKPGLGAREGVRRRIGRQHAPNQRLMLFGFACVNTVGPVAHTRLYGDGQARGQWKRGGSYDPPLRCFHVANANLIRRRRWPRARFSVHAPAARYFPEGFSGHPCVPIRAYLRHA